MDVVSRDRSQRTANDPDILRKLQAAGEDSAVSVISMAHGRVVWLVHESSVIYFCLGKVNGRLTFCEDCVKIRSNFR